MTRAQNSFMNMLTGLGSSLLVTVLSFITRTVFIRCLGESFLGIEGYFSNILSMLSLAELGFGAAITYKLYHPIEVHDIRRIQSLLKLYRNIYRIIGCIIFGLGLVLIPFLPAMVKDYERFAELGLNAALIFLLYLFNSASSYWFFAYKSAFVEANQKSYLLSFGGYVVTVISSLLQILALWLTHSFMVYLLVQITFSICRNLVFAVICDKRYPFVREKTGDRVSKEERREIYKDCYALFLHRANNIILGASDTIVLTAMLGLSYVGLYTIYLSVKSAIENLLYTVQISLQASLGSIYTTGKLEWSRLVFRAVNFTTFWMYGIGAIGAAILLNDFVTLWVGPQFLVTSWTFGETTVTTPLALLIGIEIYIYGQECYCGSFRSTMGLFQQLTYRPVASILVNLLVSIVTVPYLGIAGVVIGTIVSGLTTNLIIDPIIIHRHGLKYSAKPYFLRNLLYKLAVVAAGVASWLVCGLIPLTGIVGFLVHGCVCVIVPSAVFTLCFFRSSEFRYVLRTAKELFLLKSE